MSRVDTPTFLQMEAVECGAASLAMLLAHHGRWVTLEELRVACGVSRDGSKASNLLRAARSWGMVAKGYKKELPAVRQMALPFIAFWNFNHFLVVEGFEHGRVYLNDPAVGKRWVDDDEFDQCFTGVVLAIEPGPDFQPGGERPGVLRALARRFGGNGLPLSYLLLCGLALVLPGMVLPVFAKVFVDDVLVGQHQSWLWPLVIGLVLTGLLRAALQGLERVHLLRLETKMALAHSAQFFWRMLRLPVEFYTQRSAGDVGTRVAIADKLAHILSADLAESVLAVTTSLFFGVLMFFYDPGLALIALTSVLLSLAALQHSSTRNKQLNQMLALDSGKLMATSMSGLATIETIKSSGGEAGFFTKWAGRQARYLNAQQEAARVASQLAQLPLFLTALGNALILGLGALKVMEGAMSMGTLVAFQSLVASFTAPAQRLLDIAAKLQQLQGDVDRLDDLMRYRIDAATLPVAEGSAPIVQKLEGAIEFRNVSFGYSRVEPPLLDNFNLTLHPGQRVALVGPSGCGKSTVSKLLMGLYAPWSGEILFDGRPRSAYERFALIDSIGLVDQEAVLFSGTVRDNITMWDAGASDADVVRAAEDACIHDAIRARPGGFDALVEEGGHNFSGGQRQRIEIARALVNNPRVLALDEATSALDVATERQVEARLRERCCTCLTVAHRLSTVRDADLIVVLERGRVVQRGTHEELMADAGGLYRQLIAGDGSEAA